MFRYSHKRSIDPTIEVIFFNGPERFLNLGEDIITTNVLTKFLNPWNINVTSRVFTHFFESDLVTQFVTSRDQSRTRPTICFIGGIGLTKSFVDWTKK